MSKRDWRLHIEGIFYWIQKIGKYTANFSYDGFIKDNITIEAMIRNFEAIGEAARRIDEKYREDLRRYMIEKPLWVFIGSMVIGEKKNDKKLSISERRTVSDVLIVILFLKKVLEDRNFIEENIKKIIDGTSGLKDRNGEDIFKNRYNYLRSQNINVEEIYSKVFNANKGVLNFYELKWAKGELGLKVGDNEYFGVVNIGEVAYFKKLLLEKNIEIKDDRFTPSLFDRVNETDPNINIIIGAKKFIEGWDSWRVCSMGLINMG